MVLPGRKHSFHVLLPRKLKFHNANDLRLMRVSLYNALVAITVHLSRIDKEMAKRGVSSRCLCSFSENMSSKKGSYIYAAETLDTEDTSYNQPKTEVKDLETENKLKKVKAGS